MKGGLKCPFCGFPILMDTRRLRKKQETRCPNCRSLFYNQDAKILVRARLSKSMWRVKHE
jgi:DNA-directed RNA polymerase subunit RPC12/RpoP